MESEVIYSQNSAFIVDKIDFNGENPIIYLQEVILNGYNTIEEQSDAVQYLQESHTEHDNLQGVSKRNTVGDSNGQIRPQSSASERRGNNLRAEGRQGTLLSAESEKQVIPENSALQSSAKVGREPRGFRDSSDKEIYRPTNKQEALESIGGERKNAKQRHITDVAKSLDSSLRLVWVDKASPKLNGKNGKYVRETNTIYLAKDMSVAEMYYEVFKHEFVHRLESKAAYKAFKDYLINKSRAFEEYVLSQLKVITGEDFKGSREAAIAELTNHYYNTFINDNTLGKPIRDRFTLEDAEREIVADFGGEVLFKGSENRADIAQALSENDAEAIGSIEGRLDALEELKNDDRNLFKKLWDIIKDFIANLKGIPQNQRLVEDLEYIEQRMARVYNSKDTKKAAKQSGGVQYSWKNDSKGDKYWHIDTEQDIFKNLKTKRQFEKAAFDYIIGMRDENIVVDAIDGKQMSFIRLSAEEFTNSEESKNLYANDPIMFAQKMRLIPSIKDLASNANVNWWSPDQKNHKLFKERGFENFRGRVGIDNVIFNFVIRSGKAKFGDVFYDINLEVDSILPHAKSASEISKSTSLDINVPQKAQSVNNNFMPKSEKYSEDGPFSSGSPMQQARENLKKYENGELTREQYLEENEWFWGEAINELVTV